MDKLKLQERRLVLCVAWGISFLFLIASFFAAIWTGQWGYTFSSFITIITAPGPLVTDYFRVGNLAATFLNAGLCGLACAIMMSLPKARVITSTWSGYFLVIAHCFYGLNLLNMWPSILGFLLCCKVFHYKFRQNLSIAMFSTAFAPFISELIFRYPFYIQWDINIAGRTLNAFGIICALCMGFTLGFAVPAMLPGAKLLHRGYNLFNGGLACGLLGMLFYGFMYKTMGVVPPQPALYANLHYTAHRSSYMAFGNIFFITLFASSFFLGYLFNGKSLRGYRELLKDTGYQANFVRSYGPGLCLINFAIYGMMMLLYFDVVILLTKGAGYTGATCGVILAAMTFAISGQHPHNVWPIMVGYMLLSIAVHLICMISGRYVPWTLSTQAYMNGLAFATGLCPFTGKYGRRIGIVAGIMGAVICTSTSALHGGFVLYNGGLTAGITALLLLPMLDLYRRKEELRNQKNG